MKKYLLSIGATALLLPACSSTPSSIASSASSTVSAPIKAAASVASIVDDKTITMVKYEQIEPGMSLTEVEAILGAGTEMSRVEMASVPTTVMYMWQNSDGSNMNAMFQGGSLATKAQFGLK